MPTATEITTADLTECCDDWAYEPPGMGRTVHLGVPRWPEYLDSYECRMEALFRARLTLSQLLNGERVPDWRGITRRWDDEPPPDEDDEDRYVLDNDEGDDNSHFILSYDTRPVWEFHGNDSRVFLGVEMEVEAESGSLNGGARLAQEVIGSLGLIKSDGSLDYGMEIVTHPMTYQWAVSYWPWRVLDMLHDEGFRTMDTCGIHVHVSRSGFDEPAHVYRWLAFIYRNPEPIQALAGRGSVEYSEWSRRTRERLKDHAKGDRDERRYIAVNVQNEDTFEVRMFAGSLDPVQVQANIGFVDASVEYTRQLTSHDINHNDGWSFAAFRQWVVEQGRWEPLETQIDNRVNGQSNAPQRVRAAVFQPYSLAQRFQATRRTYEGVDYSVSCGCESCRAAHTAVDVSDFTWEDVPSVATF